MMSELQEIRNVYQGLETLYQTYLPKVDPELLHDLLISNVKVKEVLKSKIPLKVIIKIKEQQICCICHPLHLLDICAFWTCIYQPRNIQKKRTGSSDTSMVHN